MPSLTKLTLSEVSQTFTKDDLFTFVCSDGLKMTWKCEKEFTYLIEFYINAFSELSNPCDIDTIIAAIDESKHFEVRLTF